jgi:hypothetical protein
MKYDYSLLRIDYPDRIPFGNDVIRIICSVHGEFKQKYKIHKSGSGCQKCAGRNVYSFEICKSESLKHTSKKDWIEKSEPTYNAALRNGWLNELTTHMSGNKNKKHWHILNNVLMESKKYKRKSDWKRGSGGSYYAALVHGWLEECSKHMK